MNKLCYFTLLSKTQANERVTGKLKWWKESEHFIDAREPRHLLIWDPTTSVLLILGAGQLFVGEKVGCMSHDLWGVQ